MMTDKQALLGMSLFELKQAVTNLGMPEFTAKQIAKWLYSQHVSSIDEMTNISKSNREKLKEHFLYRLCKVYRCTVFQRWNHKISFPNSIRKVCRNSIHT